MLPLLFIRGILIKLKISYIVGEILDSSFGVLARKHDFDAARLKSGWNSSFAWRLYANNPKPKYDKGHIDFPWCLFNLTMP